MDFHLVETSPDYLLGILSAEGEIKFLVASSPIPAVCLWKVGSVWQRATEEEGEDDVDKSLGYVFYSTHQSPSPERGHRSRHPPRFLAVATGDSIRECKFPISQFIKRSSSFTRPPSIVVGGLLRESLCYGRILSWKM